MISYFNTFEIIIPTNRLSELYSYVFVIVFLAIFLSRNNTFFTEKSARISTKPNNLYLISASYKNSTKSPNKTEMTKSHKNQKLAALNLK